MRTHTHIQSSGDSVKSIHQSVLLQEVLQLLSPKKGETIVDATLGGGGHSRAIAECIGATGTLVGIDADAVALQRSSSVLKDVACKVVLINGNFRQLDELLSEEGVEKADGFLLDLGWSSDQLERSGRGFSFLRDEPLSMTLSGKDENTLTAEEIVNEWDEENIADILYGWGEERYARRIARAITQARVEKAITTTTELVEVIHDAVPAAYRHGKPHFATRTFQALRIAVNDELGALRDVLAVLPQRVAPGARVAIISFHSLEDRIVKRTFLDWQQADLGEIQTKKPITATEEELSRNPRARSAKLRVFIFT